jgi:hypothetical protein
MHVSVFKILILFWHFGQSEKSFTPHDKQILGKIKSRKKSFMTIILFGLGFLEDILILISNTIITEVGCSNYD